MAASQKRALKRIRAAALPFKKKELRGIRNAYLRGESVER